MCPCVIVVLGSTCRSPYKISSSPPFCSFATFYPSKKYCSGWWRVVKTSRSKYILCYFFMVIPTKFYYFIVIYCPFFGAVSSINIMVSEPIWKVLENYIYLMAEAFARMFFFYSWDHLIAKRNRANLDEYWRFFITIIITQQLNWSEMIIEVNILVIAHHFFCY